MIKGYQIQPWTDLGKWGALSEKLMQTSEMLLNQIPGFEECLNFLLHAPSSTEVLTLLRSKDIAINVFVYLLRNETGFYETHLENLEIRNLLIEKLPNCDAYTQRLFKISFLENLYKKDSYTTMKVANVVKRLERDTLINNSFLEKTGVFSDEPVQKLAEFCVKHNLEPKEMVQENAIELSFASKTFKLIECNYIIARIEQVDLRNSSELPQLIKHGNYFEVQFSEDKLLGHSILETILSELNSVEFHSDWIELILNVAGDPRSSSNSRKYNKWWAKLPQTLINNFIKVLSHNDIILFLEAINEFASGSRNFDMQRMYDRRKKMMMKLATEGVIDESRLILPETAKKFIKKIRPELDQSFIMNINEHDGLCLIYFKIGELYIIEGSHNFAVRIFKKADRIKRLMTPSMKRITYNQITSYDQKFHQDQKNVFYKISHDSRGRWKSKFIRLIKAEVNIDLKV